MGRIIAIDYGLKRVGLAVTDPLQLIATPLTTVATPDALAFLQQYTKQESVEAFVIGFPNRFDNRVSLLAAPIQQFINTLHNAFPGQQVFKQDERYTSKLAIATMLDGGFKQKDRRNKANIDKLSATIILQSFLTSYKSNE